MDDTDVWKHQLKVLGYATCLHPACSLSFLTRSGMDKHHQKCTGYTGEGDSAVCCVCGVKFSQFKSLETHMAKSHSPPAKAGELKVCSRREVTEFLSNNEIIIPSLNTYTRYQATESNSGHNANVLRTTASSEQTQSSVFLNAQTQPSSVQALLSSVQTQPCSVQTQPSSVQTLLSSVQTQPCSVQPQPSSVQTQPSYLATQPFSQVQKILPPLRLPWGSPLQPIGKLTSSSYTTGSSYTSGNSYTTGSSYSTGSSSALNRSCPRPVVYRQTAGQENWEEETKPLVHQSSATCPKVSTVPAPSLPAQQRCIKAIKPDGTVVWLRAQTPAFPTRLLPVSSLPASTQPMPLSITTAGPGPFASTPDGGLNHINNSRLSLSSSGQVFKIAEVSSGPMPSVPRTVTSEQYVPANPCVSSVAVDRAVSLTQPGRRESSFLGTVRPVAVAAPTSVRPGGVAVPTSVQSYGWDGPSPATFLPLGGGQQQPRLSLSYNPATTHHQQQQRLLLPQQPPSQPQQLCPQPRFASLSTSATPSSWAGVGLSSGEGNSSHHSQAPHYGSSLEDRLPGIKPLRLEPEFKNINLSIPGGELSGLDSKSWMEKERKYSSSCILGKVEKKESPISLREKDLMEKEAKIIEFENMVRETVLKAEQIKKEREWKEREKRLLQKEEELRRREEEARRMYEEAKKLLEDEEDQTLVEGSEGVTDVASFFEDSNLRSLNIQEEQVTLTREELEGLSPSERPRNAVIVDNSAASSTMNSAASSTIESLSRDGSVSSFLRPDGETREKQTIFQSEDFKPFRTSSPCKPRAKSLDCSAVSTLSDKTVRVFRSNKEEIEDAKIDMPETHRSSLHIQMPRERRSLCRSQTSLDQESDSSLDLSRRKHSAEQTVPVAHSNACPAPSNTSSSLSKYSPRWKEDQDEPVDLSKPKLEPESSTATTLPCDPALVASVSSQPCASSTPHEAEDRSETANFNLVKVVQNVSETYTLDESSLVIPFPEYDKAELEDLLEHSDGKMLILAISPDGRCTRLFDQAETNSASTGEGRSHHEAAKPTVPPDKDAASLTIGSPSSYQDQGLCSSLKENKEEPPGLEQLVGQDLFVSPEPSHRETLDSKTAKGSPVPNLSVKNFTPDSAQGRDTFSENLDKILTMQDGPAISDTPYLQQLNNTDSLDSGIHTDKNTPDLEINGSKDILGANRSTERDTLEAEIPSDIDNLEADLPLDRDTLEAELPSDKGSLETDILLDRDTLETNLQSDRDTLETNISSDRDTLEVDLPSDRDTLEVDLRGEQTAENDMIQETLENIVSADNINVDDIVDYLEGFEEEGDLAPISGEEEEEARRSRKRKISHQLRADGLQDPEPKRRRKDKSGSRSRKKKCRSEISEASSNEEPEEVNTVKEKRPKAKIKIKAEKKTPDRVSTSTVRGSPLKIGRSRRSLRISQMNVSTSKKNENKEKNISTPKKVDVTSDSDESLHSEPPESPVAPAKRRKSCPWPALVEPGKLEPSGKVKKEKRKELVSITDSKPTPTPQLNEVMELELTPGGKQRRAAAKKAEKNFRVIPRDKSPGSVSEYSDLFSDDSGDDYDLSKEISSKKMYRLVTSSLGERVYRCLMCPEKFKSKNKIDSHFIKKHAEELFSNQDLESDEEYSERGDRSKIRKGSSPIFAPKLDPDPRFLEREAKFRNENYCQRVQEWFARCESRKEIIRNEGVYLPCGTSSVRFRVSPSKPGAPEKDLSLQRFESMLISKAGVLFSGGPVWAMAWVPLPALQTTQFLAVSTHSSYEPVMYKSCSSHPGLIQIWKVELDDRQNITDEPKLLLGMAHSYGTVWALEWCPSGLWEDSVSLGGLAAACSDGTVRIFSVKYPKKGSRFIKYEVRKTLVPGEENQGHCLSVSWYRGPSHKYIAASFVSGLVGLWNLESTSPLLSSEQCPLPVQAWIAHNSSVTSVSLSPSSSECPRFCLTGGSDRSYRFWDLRDTCTPLQEVKRGMVTSVSWLPGPTAAAAVSHDDVFLQAHTQTLITEGGFSKAGSQPIVGQNSCVWDQSVSAWLGSLAVGTSAGELVIYVMPDAHKTVDPNRSSGRRRAYIYLTRNIAEDTASDRAGFEKARLRFYDVLNSEELPAPEKELSDKVRYSEKMETEELLHYPICSLNRVSWNPNLGAHLLLASAGQSGIVRIHTVSTLDTKELRAGMKRAGVTAER